MGLAHAPALPDPAAVPTSSTRSCTIQLNTPVNKDQPESEPTLDLAEHALCYVELLNAAGQHGRRVILDGSGIPEALKNVERLEADPGHAVWQQYLKQEPTLSPQEMLIFKDCFRLYRYGDSTHYNRFTPFMRKCRWLIAMHDRAEQYREDSLELCHKQHALILSTLSTTLHVRIFSYQFPRLIGVLSSAAQLDKNSESQQLKVMDQFLKTVKTWRYVHDHI
ncbi:hypothetical protein BDZ91DRAFT_799774 [Kalaharituber pfeilii]|nr:hypothetical protein BDZ91DRAFT_799774 [Kalaharituber pfeilii]